MGRPYHEELAELQRAPERSLPEAVETLAAAFERARPQGLFVVASGGALVVAEWACHLYRQVTGRSAVPLTPLEFVALSHPVQSTVWLLSAAGRHSDILTAAARAHHRGDRDVHALVGRAGSPLARVHDARAGHAPIELGLDVADGFLATYSVWHMARLIAEAAARWQPSLAPPQPGHALEWGFAQAQAFHGTDASLVLIHDAWTALGAYDLETRAVETALAPVWRTDWRNLGHGRHFWFAARNADTHLVALQTPSSRALGEATLSELPAKTTVTRVSIPWDDATGALASLAWSMAATAVLGSRRDRDPGRPGVPAFGERLYAGGFPYPSLATGGRREAALVRKGGRGASWQTAYAAVHAHLTTSPLRGIVLDYDGTLVATPRRFDAIEPEIAAHLNRLLRSGFTVGVATGRGDSVQSRLLEVIAPEHQNAVIIGYHNGRVVQPLSACADVVDKAPIDGQLKIAQSLLETRLVHSGQAELRARPGQLTLVAIGGTSLEALWRATQEVLALERLALDAWMSSHSVDIVAPGVGKLRVVEALAEATGSGPDAILRIGDRGAWPGNDWQMLAHPLGLSVDECSTDPTTCWNVLPAHLRGVEGTCWLLGCLSVVDDVGHMEFPEPVQ